MKKYSITVTGYSSLTVGEYVINRGDAAKTVYLTDAQYTSLLPHVAASKITVTLQPVTATAANADEVVDTLAKTAMAKVEPLANAVSAIIICTQAEYDALPASKASDGALYFIAN